jgi:hypothetical protein
MRLAAAVNAEKIDGFARLMSAKLEAGDTYPQKLYPLESSTRSRSTTKPSGSSAARISSRPPSRKQTENGNVRGFVRKWRAIDDEEFGPPQPTPDEIVEHGTPGFGALAAHTLDREQHFLTVRTHADKSEMAIALRSSRTRTTVINRTIGSSASERAFQASQSLFTLRHTPAHRVLADGASEQSPEHAAHTALVGTGQVAAADQRVGGQRAALVGPAAIGSSTRRSCHRSC